MKNTALLGVAVFGLFLTTGCTSLRTVSIIYQELMLPEEADKEMSVRLRWKGEPGRESLQCVDIYRGNVTTRISVLNPDIRWISIAHDGKIIVDSKKIPAVTLGEYEDVPAPGPGGTTADWTKN